jgi:hypothetical protein
VSPSTYTVAVPCPICGADAMRSTCVPDSVSCPACDRVYRSLDEIDAALVEDARRWWAGLDDFTRGVMRETHSTLAIKRVAVRLLEVDIDCAIVELVALAINERLPEPALRGDLDEALEESARIIARGRRRNRRTA